tara:strand:+ start:12192 stop:12527 length:336 start_codon:yes stop_codon:yes gene_type:complete
MTWKNILKGDASDMEEDYGKRSDQIVEDFARNFDGGYFTIKDPKTGEYADIEYEEDYGYEVLSNNLKEGSKLHKLLMVDKGIKSGPNTTFDKYTIHPDNEDKIEELGFVVE